MWAIETATAWRKETHFRTKTCSQHRRKPWKTCKRGSAWSGPSPPASSARSHLGPIDASARVHEAAAGCRSCQAEVPAFVDRDFAAGPEKLGLLPPRTRRRRQCGNCASLLLRPRSDDLLGFVHNCKQVLIAADRQDPPGLQSIAAKLPSLSAPCWRKSWTRECTSPPEISQRSFGASLELEPRVQTQRPQFSSISLRTSRSSSSPRKPEPAGRAPEVAAEKHTKKTGIISLRLTRVPPTVAARSEGLRRVCAQPLSKAQTEKQAERCRRLGRCGCALREPGDAHVRPVASLSAPRQTSPSFHLGALSLRA